MNRKAFAGAFGLGAMAILWVASGFLGGNHLAFLMTVVIAGVYLFGAWELRQYRQVTNSLKHVLQEIPEPLESLEAWLTGLHPSLQNTVRLRIEGDRVALPGPALTPYLVGLLVMLGMLGTFLGMVVTLNGAVFALEGTADLETIRNTFATPIKGLGLSFGTSVAGVAASAMLGLMSAICRRERLEQAQVLDTRIATTLRKFSLAYQRQETNKALQAQSQALPVVLEQMQTMMSKMERMSEQMYARQLTNQERFHQDAKEVYTGLAQSVDQTLRQSITESAQTAAHGIQPIVLSAMAALSQESCRQHERLMDGTQSQLDALAERLALTADQVTAGWAAAVNQQERTGAALVDGLGSALDGFTQAFAQRSETLLSAVQQSQEKAQAEQASREAQRIQDLRSSMERMATSLAQEWTQTGTHTLSEISRLTTSAEALARARLDSDIAWSKQQDERMQQMIGVLKSELAALRDEESLRGKAAVDRLAELQTDVRLHLTTLGTALEEPITRLIVTASEAPRAAAEVIGKLRQEVTESVARDNELLEERTKILETLNGLLEGIRHASVEQRAVIDALLATSASTMEASSQQFAHKVDAETTKLADIAGHVTSSAVEVSALGETLRYVMQSFNEANEKMITNLERIESALEKSMARSDDQLAYYIAQAREIIDLSIMSQKDMVDEIRKLPSHADALAEEVSS